MYMRMRKRSGDKGNVYDCFSLYQCVLLHNYVRFNLGCLLTKTPKNQPKLGKK